MSDLERAQEWLGCRRIETMAAAREMCAEHRWAEKRWPCSEATRLAALLAETRADEMRKLLGHLRGGDGSEFDTYLAENLKKPLVLQGFLEGRLEGLTNG